jgi:hypothetical protein
MHDAMNDAIRFQLPQALHQPALRNARHCAFKLGKSQSLRCQQMDDDPQFSPFAQRVERKLEPVPGLRSHQPNGVP